MKSGALSLHAPPKCSALFPQVSVEEGEITLLHVWKYLLHLLQFKISGQLQFVVGDCDWQWTNPHGVMNLCYYTTTAIMCVGKKRFYVSFIQKVLIRNVNNITFVLYLDPFLISLVHSLFTFHCKTLKNSNTGGLRDQSD